MLIGTAGRPGATASGALALTIVLDAFPRNIHRGTPKSFESDGRALQVASRAIEQQLAGPRPSIAAQRDQVVPPPAWTYSVAASCRASSSRARPWSRCSPTSRSAGCRRTPHCRCLSGGRSSTASFPRCGRAKTTDAARTYFAGGMMALPAYRPEVVLDLVHAGGHAAPPWRMLEASVRSDLHQVTPGLAAISTVPAIEACDRSEKGKPQSEIDRCIANAI